MTIIFKCVFISVVCLISGFFIGRNYPDIFNQLVVQLDSHSGIINIVLVLALVLATCWYASQVKKQTDLTIKDLKRRPILDGIREFLLPLSKDLEDEINNIKDHYFKFYKRNGISTINWIFIFSDKKYGLGYAKNDVFRNDHSLKKFVSEHDILYNNLIEIYEEIEKVLVNTIDIECLKKLMVEFNKKQEDVIEPLLRRTDDNLIEYCTNSFINYEYYKKHGSSGNYDIKFIKEFEEQILKCVDSDDLQKYREKEQDKLKELIDIDKKILDDIREIISDYYNEYKLMENEIEPPKQYPTIH